MIPNPDAMKYWAVRESDGKLLGASHTGEGIDNFFCACDHLHVIEKKYEDGHEVYYVHDVDHDGPVESVS